MKTEFFGIVWASIHNAWFFCLIFVLIILLVWAWKTGVQIVKTLVDPVWQKKLFPGFSYWRQKTKLIVLIVALLSLGLALLQPQWGEKEEIIKQEGRELFVALDISRSMLAADIKPHRLAFAKAKIKRLLKLLPCDRVGLLVFSGAALVQCPLTRDKAAFLFFLDHVDAQTISASTTAIDKVIKKVLFIFSSMAARKNKILVIFTDGEDFSHDLTDVREQAAKLGLHVFTYGVGTEQGGPIPIIDDQGNQQGHQKDEHDNIIFSKLNPGILHVLAQETDGRYIAPMQDDTDIKTLVRHVEMFEKEDFEDKELTTRKERYPYFLGVTLALLLLEWLL